MSSIIKEKIYPRLEELFQEDSDQFNKVVNARQARDQAKKEKDKDKLKIQALEDQALKELIPATEIPLEIAQLCLKLAEFAITTFDDGFKSALGDSGAALHAATSAVGGCLTIIDLNLTSFSGNDWTQKILNETNDVRSSFQKLNEETSMRRGQLEAEAHFKPDIKKLKSEIRIRDDLNYNDIENFARGMQKILYKHKNRIWNYIRKEDLPADPIQMLKPEFAIELLGYEFNPRSTLGQHSIEGRLREVAGTINSKEKSIDISEQFPPEVRNFTAAHELGHALLHPQQSLHRDRAIDSSESPRARAPKEVQADKFAAFYLMPRNLLRSRFKEIFQIDPFEINADTAFFLNQKSENILRRKASSKRGLARLIASTEFYNGRAIFSLAKQFGVSTEAMAIRLEELELIKWP